MSSLLSETAQAKGAAEGVAPRGESSGGHQAICLCVPRLYGAHNSQVHDKQESPHEGLASIVHVSGN